MAPSLPEVVSSLPDVAPRFNFGAYHWRRRFRRLASALGLLGLAGLLWLYGGRRSRDGRPHDSRDGRRGRVARLVAAGLALAGVRRGLESARRLVSPPPWVVESYKYDALARDLPLDDADRALDVGCGTGRSLVGLAAHVPDDCAVVGLDVFDARVILGNGPALARRNAARAGLDAEVVAGDASRLPVAAATQDVVTACRVLHDLPRDDAERALAEARRVCRPDGTLGVLELPLTHGTDADPLDYWRRMVADAGFEVRRARRVRRDEEEAAAGDDETGDGKETGDGDTTDYLVLVAEPG